MEIVNIALPKGRLLEPSLNILRQAGVPVPPDEEWGRGAVVNVDEGGIRLFVIRDDDVPTYVTQGAADLGVVGKDVLLESTGDYFELFDLEEGFCRLVVAVPAQLTGAWNKNGNSHLRVVTKYPRAAADFFSRKGILAEIIQVHGATELAPSVGLADVVVDVVATGRTLRENDLVEVEEITTSTARLVANPVSYRLKGDQLWPLIEGIRQVVGKKEAGSDLKCGD